MRVVRREAERLVDARFELLGDHVLQEVGLVVHLVDVDAQRLRQVELEQAVVACDLEGHLLSLRGQGDAPIRSVGRESENRQLLDHGRGRGR